MTMTMTSSSLQNFSCLKELELEGRNDLKLDSEAIGNILTELLVELDKSQVIQLYLSLPCIPKYCNFRMN